MKRIKDYEELVSVLKDSGKKLVSWGGRGSLYESNVNISERVSLLSRLKSEGIATVLISNSPETAFDIKHRFKTMGYDGLLNGFYTSGMLAVRDIYQHYDRPKESTPYFVIGDVQKETVFEASSKFHRINKPEDAIIAIAGDLNETRGGFRSPAYTADPFLDDIKECVHQRVHFWNIMPERHYSSSKWGTVISSGSIAKEFERLGGDVISVGKPEKYIFEWAYGDWDICSKEEIIHLGDDAVIDVAGAGNVGVDTVLLTSGFTACWMAEGLEHYLKNGGIAPTYIF
ncbi:MAG: HAD hydrolase-like protein [Lactobacillus sp.]|jgi:HAD superfamily hydrolase (TIGR01459 family)|nr:HAD hydrolase-like protein [Lactobacillus sp.]